MPAFTRRADTMSILHPTDFSQDSMLAFCHALKIAVQYKASLSILHVDADDKATEPWDEFPGVRSTLQQWGLLSEDAPRSAVYDQLQVAVEKIDTTGPVIPAIIHFLDHHPFDLMVLSTHGDDGLPRWLHRHTAEPLARRALLPTLFVPHGSRGFVSPSSGQLVMRRLLMPVDHSPSPRYAFAEALEVLEGLGDDTSELVILHVGNELPRLRIANKLRWKHEIKTVAGSPVETIVEEAKSSEADLILMATAGHQGFLDVIRGSTSERVLRHAPCPVLTVPAADDKRR